MGYAMHTEYRYDLVMDLQTPRTLFCPETIDRRVAELAGEISRDYAHAGDLLLVGTLRGAFIFLADLARKLSIPRWVDFIAVAAYEKSASTGRVQLVMDLRTDICNKHVLVIEDVVDTGQTLGYLLEMLQARGPASLKTCALLRKIKDRSSNPGVDYLGFETTDDWVVGYGLDYANHYRALPYIGVIDPPNEPPQR